LSVAVDGTRLGLLDGFELRHEGSLVRLPLSTQRLLAFLALHERPMQRLYVAGTLWLESSQQHANANLRTALWRLGRRSGALVNATATDISLANSVNVDLREISTRAQRVLAHDVRTEDLDELCLAGDLLPDWYDDWLLIERERFRQLRLHALESLCEFLADAGHFAAAAQAGLAAVAGEPLRDSSHRALIRTHLLEGNASEAVRQYGIYREILRTQLGLEPSQAMQELVGVLAERPARAGRIAP
jgi:DNA-binding SARP family transcriptional activator